MTGREIFFLIIGSAITFLIIMSATRFYERDYRKGILFFLLAIGLAFVFFRKRKTALAIISLSTILVNVGLSFPFHPSILGFALIVVSSGGLYFIARWGVRRYPYMARKHWHKVFEGEAAMETENARIEAEAREVIKNRPAGPYRFL